MKVKVKEQLVERIEVTKEHTLQLTRGKDDENMRQQIEWGEDELNDAVEVVELKLPMQPMALDAALEKTVRKENWKRDQETREGEQGKRCMTMFKL